MRLAWALVAVACAPSADKSDADTATPFSSQVTPPDVLGPHAVGTTDVTIVGRTGVELVVQVWYPTDSASTRLYPYMGEFAGIALDAPAPLCDEVRPVLAFSHGNIGLRWQSIFMTEHLASHGFVIVSPDHTGNTTFDNDEERKPELVFRRPWDISDSVDHLFESADDVVSGLAGCVDPAGGFAISGHSFGGYTTMAVAGAEFDADATAAHCQEMDDWLCDEAAAHVAENPDMDRSGSDARVWAAIPMAPAGHEVLIGGLSKVQVPTMVLGGSVDDLTTVEEQVGPIYDGLTQAPKMLGLLQNAGHYVFSNACDLVSGQNEECGDPYLSTDEGHPEIAAVTTAYLRWVLGEDEMADFLPPTDEMWNWTSD